MPSSLARLSAQGSLFACLAPEELSRLVGAFELRLYQPGAVIIKQGEAGRCFFILQRGLAACTEDGVGVVRPAIKSGEGFGEWALLFNTPRAATVTALTDVAAWVLGAPLFHAALRSRMHVDVSVEEQNRIDAVVNHCAAGCTTT